MGFRKTAVESLEWVLDVKEGNLPIMRANLLMMKALDFNMSVKRLTSRRIIIRRAQAFEIVRNICSSIRVRKSQKNGFSDSPK
jgi:hypothetical protein